MGSYMKVEIKMDLVGRRMASLKKMRLTGKSGEEFQNAQNCLITSKYTMLTQEESSLS